MSILFSLGETFANLDIPANAPLAGASAVWNERTLGCFVLNETFANLLFVWFGYDRRACEISLRQCLLGIQRSIRFECLLPHRPETAPPRSATAASVPLLAALCLSLPQPSSFPYRRSSGRRRPYSYTVLSVATRPSFRRDPDSVCDTLTRQRVVLPHAFGPCGADGTRAGAARGSPGEVRQEALQSILISLRRSTVAPFMQPSLSASSGLVSSAGLPLLLLHAREAHVA